MVRGKYATTSAIGCPRDTSEEYVSGLREEIAYYLSREVGVSMAEIGRQMGVPSTVAKAIKKRETGESDSFRQRPLVVCPAVH